MFNFFRSKKPVPTDPPQETTADPASGNDEYVFIDKKPDPVGPGGSLYPTIGQPKQPTIQPEQCSVNYLQGVPFKLSSELTTGDTTELSRIQVNEILSFLTRAASYNINYDFELERSLVDG